MNTRLLISSALLLTGLATHVVAADVTIKPGLWLITHQGSINHAGMNVQMPDAKQMQAMMKNLPPDMQAKMAQNMGQNGMAAMTGDGIKICVSQEQAAQNNFATPPNSQCKIVNQNRSGNTINVKMQCPQGEMESTVTLQSDTAWSSTMKGQMKEGDKTTSMDMQATGKWLGNDCGTLKPLGAPAQTK